MSHVAIVTGGSTGIGKALGGALTARGDTVVLAAFEDEVHHAAAELTARGPGHASGALVDVRDAAAMAQLVQSVHRDHGRLDLMVNNAGIAAGGLIEDTSPGYWDALYDTNVRGVLNGVYAAYPIMIEQGFGQIANTASLAGVVPAPYEGPYTMSKFAVVGLTLTLRLEAQRHGIRVNVICPGAVETPIYDKGNPPGLPPVRRAVTDPRAMIRRATRSRLCDADRFAADVLSDLERDEPIIVRPASARLLWLAYRMSPRLILVYGRRYLASIVSQFDETRPAEITTTAPG